MYSEDELRNAMFQGDCLEVLKKFPTNSIDQIVTDPPYGLSKQPKMEEVLKHWLSGENYEHSGNGFMGKSWDSFVPSPQIWKECFRVLKDGGSIMAFAGTRTYDLMMLSMRIGADFYENESGIPCKFTNYHSWAYGSGFPKSLNIEKALQKKGEDELAKLWSGYGTALKPAHEPIAIFTKGDGKPPESKDGSKFFYSAKTAKKERNLGCGNLFWKDGKEVSMTDYYLFEAENEMKKGKHNLTSGNIHPTVKPRKLMSHLVDMVKEDGCLVLDPFMGSGSTLCACIDSGVDFVGIDMDDMAISVAKARTDYLKK